MAYGKIGWYFCVADSTFHRTLQAQLSAVSPWISRATQNQVTQRSHHSRWRGTRCATAKGSFLWANSGSKIHQVQRWLCHQIKSRKVNGGFTYHLFPGLLYLLHFIYLVYLGLFKQQWRSSADVQNILHHKSTWVSNYKPFGIPPFFLRPPKITKSKWPKSSTSQHPSTPPKKTKKKSPKPWKKNACQASGALHSPNGHPFNAKGSLSPVQGIASPIKWGAKAHRAMTLNFGRWRE